MNHCPWCNDERLEAVLGMIENWAEEGKALLTRDDWAALAHAIAYHPDETRS